MADEHWKNVQRRRFDDELLVLRRESFRNEPGVLQLAEIALRKSDREGADGLRVRCHERDDGARVQPSGEKRTERDVAHEPDPHGLIEPGPEAIEGLWLGGLGLRLERKAPGGVVVAENSVAERQ